MQCPFVTVLYGPNRTESIRREEKVLNEVKIALLLAEQLSTHIPERFQPLLAKLHPIMHLGIF